MVKLKKKMRARRPSVLVGNALYFLYDNYTSIVEFDMATMTLSVVYKFDNTCLQNQRFTIDDKIRGLQLMTTSNNTCINSENRDQKQGTMREEALTTPSTPTTCSASRAVQPRLPAASRSCASASSWPTSSSSAANIFNSRCACSMAVASLGTCSYFSCSAPWLSSVATISRTSCLDRAARYLLTDASGRPNMTRDAAWTASSMPTGSQSLPQSPRRPTGGTVPPSPARSPAAAV
uniref:Uncharacterized protein n=1 Tax=Oryza meridionalis TaxID=40149 RepID=A0A0E0DFN8_9ORYZ